MCVCVKTKHTLSRGKKQTFIKVWTYSKSLSMYRAAMKAIEKEEDGHSEVKEQQQNHNTQTQPHTHTHTHTPHRQTHTQSPLSRILFLPPYPHILHLLLLMTGLQKLALARKPKDNTTPVICETKKGGEKKKQLKLRSQKIVHFKMRLKYIYHISFTALLRAANTHTHTHTDTHAHTLTHLSYMCVCVCVPDLPPSCSLTA